MKALSCLIIYLIFVLILNPLSAQSYEIKGEITDSKSGEPMIGVHITIKNDIHGTITGNEGVFVLKTQIPPPLVLHISYVGFVPQDIEVTSATTFLDIKMEEQFLLGQEVVISASRIEENILRSPVSVEKMNLRDLKQISTGNIFGLSQIDVNSLEMVVGASSALYGPGGMNGTLVMESKDPFQYQGLTVSFQSGVMNIASQTFDNLTPMFEVNFRYAKAFSNRIALT